MNCMFCQKEVEEDDMRLTIDSHVGQEVTRVHALNEVQPMTMIHFECWLRFWDYLSKQENLFHKGGSNEIYN